MHVFTHRWTRLLAALGVFSAIVALCILSGRGVSADSPAEPAAQPTYATIGVFQQGANGYTGASDVTISRTEPDTNFENQSLHLHCKDYTSLPEQQGVLLRFDLSSVPRNAQIGGGDVERRHLRPQYQGRFGRQSARIEPHLGGQPGDVESAGRGAIVGCGRRQRWMVRPS